MSIDTAIVAALTGHAGLQALIGNDDSPETYRLTPLVQEQGGALPAVVYQRVVGAPEITLTDPSSSGVERVVYQFTAWAATHAAAHAVIEQVRLALRAATTVTAWPLSLRDLYDPEAMAFGAAYDFSIWYR